MLWVSDFKVKDACDRWMFCNLTWRMAILKNERQKVWVKSKGNNGEMAHSFKYVVLGLHG